MKATLRKGLLAAATAGAMVVSAGAANAGSIESLFATGINLLNDRSAEVVIKGTGNVSTDIESGDYLFGIVKIDSINGTLAGGGTVNNEFTAVFLTQVSSVTSAGTDPTCGGCAVSDFVFAAPGQSAWETYLGLPVGTTTPDGNDLSSTVMMWFEDTTPPATPFSNTGTVAGDVAVATDGILRLTLELGDVGTSWEGEDLPTDPADLANYPSGANVGNIQIGLNVGYESFGGNFVQNLLGFKGTNVDFVGNAKITLPTGPGSAGTEWPIWDQADINFFYVPEPATLGLMGVGLFGIGVLQRRRRKAAA
jgi:hypothetical protein